MRKFLEGVPHASPRASVGAVDDASVRGKWRGPLIASGTAFALLVAWLAGSSTLTGINRNRGSGQAANSLAAVDLVAAANKGRVERLADGSVVTLGAGSRLRVRFGAGRQLELVQGRARFEVAHEQQPFIVDARGTLVTARGTIFDVSIGQADRVRVSLIGGLVDVKAPTKATGPSRAHRLRPGQSLMTVARPDGVPTPEAIRAEPSATNAPDVSGVREFHGVRLDDLVAEANRTARVPIVLADPRLGEIKISRRFKLSDTAELAGRTAAVFDLDV